MHTTSSCLRRITRRKSGGGRTGPDRCGVPYSTGWEVGIVRIGIVRLDGLSALAAVECDECSTVSVRVIHFQVGSFAHHLDSLYIQQGLRGCGVRTTRKVVVVNRPKWELHLLINASLGNDALILCNRSAFCVVPETKVNKLVEEPGADDGHGHRRSKNIRKRKPPR